MLATRWVSIAFSIMFIRAEGFNTPNAIPRENERYPAACGRVCSFQECERSSASAYGGRRRPGELRHGEATAAVSVRRGVCYLGGFVISTIVCESEEARAF